MKLFLGFIVSHMIQSVNRYSVFWLNGYNFFHCVVEIIKSILFATIIIAGVPNSRYGRIGYGGHENECNETHKLIKIVRIIESKIRYSISIRFDDNLIHFGSHELHTINTKHKTSNTYKKWERIPKNPCTHIFVCLLTNYGIFWRKN